MDNLTIECSYTPPAAAFNPDKQGCIEMNGMVFKPAFGDNKLVIYYHKRLSDNLHIKMHRNRIEIINSIHKYIHGNNYGDLCLSEIFTPLISIAAILNIPNIMDGKVKKIEYAVNVEVESPERIYKSLICHKGKDASVLQDYNGNPYGVYFEHTDYKIKCYNKTYEVNRNSLKVRGRKGKVQPLMKSILRFEIAVKDMDYLQQRNMPINIFTVADLCNPDNWVLLLSDLIEQIESITKLVLPDFKRMSRTERTAYSRITHPILRDLFRTENKSLYKKDLMVYNGIDHSDTYLKEVFQQIHDKGEELIYN